MSIWPNWRIRFLTFLLLFQQFALTRYVAAVTFGKHVLAQCLDPSRGR